MWMYGEMESERFFLLHVLVRRKKDEGTGSLVDR